MGRMPTGANMMELDLIGLKCPMPVLKTQKALSQMQTGQRLFVTTSDPLASLDLPHFCSEKGHKVIKIEQQDDLSMHFEIEKG